MKYNIDGAEITKEKNLWQVFLIAKKTSLSTSHIIICLCVASLLFLNAFLIDDNIKHIISDIRTWSNFGFNFTITTLGFLIAGFTIFATLSKPEMMISMMLHINKESGLPTLKYNFMAFMKVFISFIFFTFLYLFIILFGQQNGLISNVATVLSCSIFIKELFLKIFYVIVGLSLIYLVLIIKTFIFNIYAIVMTSIRWEYEKAAKAENDALILNKQDKASDNLSPK